MFRYIKIVRGHKRPLRFLFARLLVKSGLCRFFTIPQDGYRLRFHPSNLSEQLWVSPRTRAEALEFFRAYLRPGDRVIDVGANIGDTVLTSAIQVGPSGTVWAVEPHPRTYRFLLSNLELNHINNVETINCAVGATSGEVTFADDRRDDMNRVGAGTLTVQVQRLDTVVKCRDTIALLKVDVEGYEKPVFDGADEIFAKTNTIHFEVSQRHFSWFGYKISDLLQLLKLKGFLLFSLRSNGYLEEVDTDYEPEEVENLIGLKDPTDFQTRTGWVVRRR
jgi:FkbM family methyltransferase